MLKSVLTKLTFSAMSIFLISNSAYSAPVKKAENITLCYISGDYAFGNKDYTNCFRTNSEGVTVKYKSSIPQLYAEGWKVVGFADGYVILAKE